VSTYPRTGLQRILAGAPTPSLRVTLYGQDGDAEAASGTLTCTITRADGTAVGSANRATAAGQGVGAYTCALTTAEALTLDVLTAVWSDGGVVRATSYHRIVGAFPFDIAELSQRAGIAEDTNRDELLVERDRITDLFEEYVGAVVPRYDLEQWQATGTCTHVLRHRPVRTVRSVTVDGDAENVDDLEVDYASGVVTGDVLFYDSCTIGYEHGLDRPPHDLRDAMITAVADSIHRRRGVVGPRVRSISDGMGVTQQFGYAGKDHPTGLDEVDAVIMRYARPRLGIA
jgi:hypothetical protein